MSKSIPLKEIVGFLPYGLQMKSKNDFVSPLYRKLTVDGFQFHLDNRIPCVRPLSDLTKEITHNGETFIPYEYFEELEDVNYFEDNYWMQKLFRHEEGDFIDLDLVPYGALLKLFEWHFDIYDWIKYGLAVDLNTL